LATVLTNTKIEISAEVSSSKADIMSQNNKLMDFMKDFVNHNQKKAITTPPKLSEAESEARIISSVLKAIDMNSRNIVNKDENLACDETANNISLIKDNHKNTINSPKPFNGCISDLSKDNTSRNEEGTTSVNDDSSTDGTTKRTAIKKIRFDSEFTSTKQTDMRSYLNINNNSDDILESSILSLYYPTHHSNNESSSSSDKLGNAKIDLASQSSNFTNLRVEENTQQGLASPSV
jgi:hypothetical protein